MCDGGESAQGATGVSRGERFDCRHGTGPRRRHEGIERNRRRTDDCARPRVREPNVEPEGLPSARIAEREVDQGSRRSTAPTDFRPHFDPLLPHRPGKLDALLIFLFDKDTVPAQGLWNAGRTTGQEERNTRQDNAIH